MDNMTHNLSDIVAKLNLVVLRPNSGWIVIQVSHFVPLRDGELVYNQYNSYRKSELIIIN